MKEHEIRPKGIFEQYLELSRKDAEIFFDTNNRKTIPCPACFSEKYAPAFSKQGFDYVECVQCSTLFMSPRPSLSQFEKFYVNSQSSEFWAKVFFPAVAEPRRIKIFKPRVQKILEFCKAKGLRPETALDVGAGFGIFLEELQKKQPKVQISGIEPSPILAEACREKGIEILETIAEKATNWKEKADLLTCFEVIEHVHNPLLFVKSLFSLLKNSGTVVLSGLSGQGFDILTLWKNSKSIAPPHHINFISIKGFEILFKNAGFEDIEIVTPGKLDVDIVLNSIQEDPSINIGRFAKILLEKNENVLNDFQNFLAENQLSSHCWILARKPA